MFFYYHAASYETKAQLNSHSHVRNPVFFIKSQKVLKQSGVSESVKDRGQPNDAMQTSH